MEPWKWSRFKADDQSNFRKKQSNKCYLILNTEYEEPNLQ